MSRIVVVGTGTGVGKTEVALALVTELRARGVDAVGLKPVETGVDPKGGAGGSRGDGARLEDASSVPLGAVFHVKHGCPGSTGLRHAATPLFHVKHPTGPELPPLATLSPHAHAPAPRSPASPSLDTAPTAQAARAPDPTSANAHDHTPSPAQPSPAPYLFTPAISPHLAAHLTGVTIDPSRIRAWVESHTQPIIVVESAGALFSPLGPHLTNFDLALALDPALLVLVAPDRLGVLHDLTTTLGLMRQHGRQPDAVALSTPSIDTSTGANAHELERLAITAVHACFDHRSSPSAPHAFAAAQLLRHLHILPNAPGRS